MSTESQQVIAREAARDIWSNRPQWKKKDIQLIKHFILAAIEKAHQNGWHEGRQYQVDYGTQPAGAASGQEWTPESVESLIHHEEIRINGKPVADAHNAALAAEREQRSLDLNEAIGTIAELEQQLAAELEKNKK